MPESLLENLVLPLGEAPATVPLRLTLVKPGRFLMGNDAEDANDDEQPVHEIRFTYPFYIGTFPVTQAQWTAVFPRHNRFFPKVPDLPVSMVTWPNIVTDRYPSHKGPPEAFLTRINRQLASIPKWASYAFRLPTEPEWEYAAKGGHLAPQNFKTRAKTTDLYPEYAGGDKLNPVGGDPEYDYENFPWALKVGRKQANQLGLYDLSGNYGEWCADIYDSKIYRERAGKINENPPAVEEGPSKRVVRGGSFFSPASKNRLSNRHFQRSTSMATLVSFRLVLAPVQASE
jgi:formylglycine-generating enzyme required for sulfatase activity